MNALACEEVAQVIGVLDELGIDAWLTPDNAEPADEKGGLWTRRRPE